MSLLIDIAIVAALAGTVIYNYRLARRVRALLVALHKLEPALQSFSLDVDRSAVSITELHSAAQGLQQADGRVSADSATDTQRPEPTTADPREAAVRGFFTAVRERGFQ